MRIFYYSVCCLIILMNADACAAEGFRKTLSLQGYTGLLNTPNAEVTDEGKIAALYANQKESQWRNRSSREDSYIFSVGLFSFAEIGGRLTDAEGISTGDLSANFKIKIPLSTQGNYLPDIAFGMQDVGGGKNLLQTKYLVATEEWRRFRFSLGYGAGPERMKGAFGGIELKVRDWLYLLGENDTKETNVGVRLVTPDIFGWPVSIQVTAKTSFDYQPGNMEFGIGLQIPLGRERHNRTPLPEKEDQVRAPAADKNLATGSPGPPMPVPEMAPGKYGTQGDSSSSLQLLRERLVADGFQNVQIGTDRDAVLLLVEYENSRYNHNELDGLGVVVGTIMDTVPPGFEMLQIVMKKKGIRVLQVSAPLADFQEFLHDPAYYDQFNANLEITTDVTVDKEVRFIDGASNSSWLKSELVLYPGLKTYVGTTDFASKFDYLLSLKTDYFLNAWKGAVFNARWDIPLDWSENFNDDHVFRNNREDSQLERLMVFQAVKVAPTILLNLGMGRIVPKTNGTLNELMWTPGNGNHRFMLKQAYLASSDIQAPYQQNNLYLGSYRYYFSPLDLYLEATAGQFLDQDRGFTVEMKRFFGDTAFSVFYKNSETETNERVQMGGLMISLPLTPRRDMKPYVLQVKGYSDWNYVQETKIVAPGNTNNVNTSIGFNPKAAYSLERVFTNRDRLSEEYIRKHLLRLRDAYITYRE